MFLSELKIWNFRKYGLKDGDKILKDNFGLRIEFKKGLNVLIGENDSGKSTIIDAIKHVLMTKSNDYLKLDTTDFHQCMPKDSTTRAEELKIECIFRGFEPEEGGNFLEWLGFEKDTKEDKAYLRVWLTAHITDSGKIMTEVKAGPDETGSLLDWNARELLKIVYLKPLRDAEQELTPGKKSRLAQILKAQEEFKRIKDSSTGKYKKHILEKIMGCANTEIRSFFELDELPTNEILGIADDGKTAYDTLNKISSTLEKLLKKGDTRNPYINIVGDELWEILNKLGLNIDENSSGLGTLNLLYIALELIFLEKENEQGLKLALIEELEAHLHPQAQLRVINYLLTKNNQQFILTTHSITLASRIPLDNLIICKDDDVFPMWKGKTELEDDDYEFLERFLDDTKANLFFASGVIIVEGDAENILIPTIAKKIGKDLSSYSISVVNVGSTALRRYAKIFMRMDSKPMRIPVAIVTDLDLAQTLNKDKNIVTKKKTSSHTMPSKEERVNALKKEYNKQYVEVFPSPLWTLEYDLLNGDFAELLFEAIYCAQLNQSRVNRHNFTGVKHDEIEQRRKKAKIIYQKRVEETDKEKTAYNIYTTKLANNKKVASKAVTAQYFVKFINDEITEDKLRNDPKLEYIIKAINHVTNNEVKSAANN